MYGTGLGVVNTATGVALLPNTGDSKALFVAAVTLLATGAAILVASVVLARKSRRSEAN